MYDILVMIIALVVSISITVIGTLFIRKKFGHEHLSRHNEIAGFIYAVIGVVYAVLIAFVVIVVWENHQEAHSIVENEAISIAAIQSVSSGFQDDFAFDVNEKLQEYLKQVVSEDWVYMESDNKFFKVKNKPSDKTFNELRNIIFTYSPINSKEEMLLDKMIDKLEDLAQNRKLRFFSAKLKIPGFMWFIIIAGGGLVIIFAMFFSSANLWSQLLMVSILSTSLLLVVMLIFAMNHPYSGLISVEADSFLNMIK